MQFGDLPMFISNWWKVPASVISARLRITFVGPATPTLNLARTRHQTMTTTTCPLYPSVTSFATRQKKTWNSFCRRVRGSATGAWWGGCVVGWNWHATWWGLCSRDRWKKLRLQFCLHDLHVKKVWIARKQTCLTFGNKFLGGPFRWVTMVGTQLSFTLLTNPSLLCHHKRRQRGQQQIFAIAPPLLLTYLVASFSYFADSKNGYACVLYATV